MGRKSLVWALTLLFSFGCAADLSAQSKKKRAKEQQTKNEQRNLLQAEIIFLEGEKYYMIEDFGKALIFFQKSLELNPQNAACHYKIAQILLAGEESEKALIYATQALQLEPENKYYYLLQADIYTKQTNYAAAAQTYESLLEKVPNTHQYLYDLAALYVYSNDFDAALNTYQKVEAKYGVSKELVFSRQRILLKQNKLDEALQEGVRLVNLFPNDSEYTINLAELFLANNRESEAVPYLNEYLEKDPNHARARLLLAEVFKKQGKVNEAMEQMVVAFSNPDLDLTPKLNVLVEYMKQLPDPIVEENALKLASSILEAHPSDGNAYAVNGDLYLNLARENNNLEQKRKALDFYLKAAQLDKSNFSVWQNVLQIEGELSEYDSLAIHADQAIEVFPNQAPLYYYSGFANLSLDQPEEAVFALEQGKKLSRNDPSLKILFNTLLGDAYNELQDYDKSDEAYETVLELDPDNDHVLNNYSYFLSLRKKDLDKARKMSSKLVKRNPKNPTFLDTHAWVLYMLGDFKEAKGYLETALQHDASGTIIEHYGDVLFKLGDIENAVKQWNRAKGMDDTSELIDKKIADRKLYE